MKRHFIPALALLVILISGTTCFARKFKDESLNYRVMYKLGLVNKQAGHATLSLKNRGRHYELLLTAASEPWADKIYMARDTLIGVVEIDGFRPLSYRKMAHEKGDFKLDVVDYTYAGETVVAKAHRKQYNSKNELKKELENVFEVEGTAVDILSSYYYMRLLPFHEIHPGFSETISVFSGKRRELLTLRYVGEEKVTLGKEEYPAYHISFTFTDAANPGKTSSAPMDAWIRVADLVPLKLVGKLPVGKVECYLVE